jgi:hypothetical protein
MIGAQDITVTRQSKGNFVDGVFVPGEPYPLTIRGCIQPIGAQEIERLPEAARLKARFSLYADTLQPELNLTDVDKPAGPDRIKWNGRDHELQALGDWSHLGGTAAHIAYALIEVGAEEDDE